MSEHLEQSMNESLKQAKQKEYAELVEETKPKTPMLKNICWAFLVGGLISVIGQIIYELLKLTAMTDKHCVTVTLMILIAAGAILTGLGLYDKIGKFAGAGSIVPISGFSNSMVAPALEWKTEGLIAGLAAKLFTLAGPVIVYGVCVSVVLGLLKYLWLLFTGGLP
ncbi:MAG TPA: stage V sporulation protein AC [Clostridiales bacterium]|nr:stage V sporulation protein AC [Clostridiales bacterium]